jgi:hypothetical protein
MNHDSLSKAELLDLEDNEGAYQFLPEWNDTMPSTYGQLN